MKYKSYKYLLDRIIALILLCLALPLMIAIALLIWLCNPNESFFFIHKRPGLNGRLFNLIKFRTMDEILDPSGVLIPDEERITWLGGFLRKTSLDELPQVFNVLKGEMSLIGPRPFLPEYLPLYSEIHQKRHAVKPGITGWAQVNGRNGIGWEQKLDHDIEYVENLSLRFDLKILLLTFKTVILADSISHNGKATMPRFIGYSE